MDLSAFKKTKGYIYAKDVVENKFPASFYIKKVCKKFLEEIDSQYQMEYYFDLDEADRLIKIMALINFATGSAAGKSLYEVCVGYQYFFITNLFCWKRKDNNSKRRYEVILLWIARKNSKSCNAGLIMIILMLTEPKYSEFYLAANTREQAKIVYNETRKLIQSSPYISDKFNIKRDVITCKLNENTLKALSSDYNTTDGLRVSAACIDEVGAAKDSGLIESMTSGMLSVSNRLLILISTSYPNQNNPFLDWVEYSRRVIDGVVQDEKLFAMLYSLDEGDSFTPQNFLKANPLQAELSDGIEYLTSEYKKALEMGGGKLTSFKCKHLNIWLNGDAGEVYIPIDLLKRCSVNDIGWDGKDVYLGIDLAQTDDNCAVSMITVDEGRVISKSWTFIPHDKIEEKSTQEKVNYSQHIESKDCFACGDNIVNYGFIEDFMLNIENEYGVRIIGVAFDRFNCMSTAQRLEREGYDTTEVMQKPSVLHQPTKFLKELILTGEFSYEKNKLLEINFSNAKVIYDDQLNMFLSKKRARGKIDICASLINAISLLQTELNNSDFAVQVI